MVEELKRHCFDTVDEIEMELQEVLDSLQEKDFFGASDALKRH